MKNSIDKEIQLTNNFKNFDLSHSCINPSGNSIVWRYLDIAKYLDLIVNRRLFFASPLVFKSDDPFEGSFKHRIFEENKFNLGIEALTGDEFDCFGGKLEGLLKKRISNDDNRILINCWHISSVESAAMWKIYSGINKGIAIKSSVKRLQRAFKVSGKPVFLSKVCYGDFPKQKKYRHTLWSRYFLKREAFKYENELRLVSLASNFEEMISNSGGYINVDIDMLIDEIFISPDSPEWFLTLVEEITNGKYGLQKNIVRSTLMDIPEY